MSEETDPRIRRTRILLQQALEKLLKEKDFDRISVQDIADAATVNRVTFYDHYSDKFALLECVVASRFNELLARRNIQFECKSALRGMILAVCDYLAAVPAITNQPHFQNAIISVVRRVFLDGFSRHPWDRPVPVEMAATALSWAIYGAAQDWVRMPDRTSSEDIVGPLVTFVSPLLG